MPRKRVDDRKQLKLTLRDSFYDEIKQAAKNSKLPVATYVRELLSMAFIDDYKSKYKLKGIAGHFAQALDWIDDQEEQNEAAEIETQEVPNASQSTHEYIQGDLDGDGEEDEMIFLSDVLKNARRSQAGNHGEAPVEEEIDFSQTSQKGKKQVNITINL